jgi:hypothetical protein
MSEPYWEPFASPGLGTIQGMVPIERKVLAAAGPIDFQNIPQDYDHLRLIVSPRTEEAGAAGQCFMRFNGDSSAIYDWQRLYGYGSTANAAEGQASQHFFTFWYPMASTVPTTRFGHADILIPNYRMLTSQKGFTAVGNSPSGGTFNNYAYMFSGLWRSAAAVNRIQLLPQGLGNWSAGSIATLYGILDTPLAITPFIPPGQIMAFANLPTLGPTGVTGTGNGDSIANLGPAVYEAVPYYWEFFGDIFDSGGAAVIEIRLHDGTAPGPLVVAQQLRTATVNPGDPHFIRYRFTPTAGSHTFNVRWRDVTTGRTYQGAKVDTYIRKA